MSRAVLPSSVLKSASTEHSGGVVSSVKYRALNDLTYPPNRAVSAGEVVDDIPAKSIKWLVEQGHIEQAGGKDAPAAPVATESDKTPAPDAETPAEDPAPQTASEGDEV
jgi:hypothetical protein